VSCLRPCIEARAIDALGQTGNVVSVNVDVDLQFTDGTKVRGVSSKRLTHVRHFRPVGPWRKLLATSHINTLTTRRPVASRGVPSTSTTKSGRTRFHASTITLR